MVAGGLEVATQENLATEPSVTTTGTGCNANSEIPAKNGRPSVAVGRLKEGEYLYIYTAAPLNILSPKFDGC